MKFVVLSLWISFNRINTSAHDLLKQSTLAILWLSGSPDELSMHNHKALSFGERKKSKLPKRLSGLLRSGNLFTLVFLPKEQALVLYFMISIEEAERLLKKENICLSRKEVEAILEFLHLLAKIEYEYINNNKQSK